MLHAGVFALRAESCSWLKAAFGSIHLDLHKTTMVFLLEEAKSEYNLDSLSENLMLMMLPFVVGLYELKTTKNLEQRLSSKLSTLCRFSVEDVWCANIDICYTVIHEHARTHAQHVAVGLANSSLFSYGIVNCRKSSTWNGGMPCLQFYADKPGSPCQGLHGGPQHHL